jgi:hypothetical protein
VELLGSWAKAVAKPSTSSIATAPSFEERNVFIRRR